MYKLPVSNYFSFVVKQAWLYSSDTRSIGINKLERLTGMGGMQYNYNTDSYFGINTGAERENQMGIASYGPLLNIDGKLSNIDIEDYKIESNLLGDYTHQSNGRINSNLDFKMNVDRAYDIDNIIILNFNYKLLNRDFLSLSAGNVGAAVAPIENRQEKRINADANINFSLSKILFGTANLSASDAYIDRSYKKPLQDLNLSNVIRQMHELNLAFLLEGTFKVPVFSQVAGIAFSTRNEENGIARKFEMTEFDESSLKALERLRDNISYRTRFYFKSNWLATRRDSASLNYSVSLFQYDTPSNENNDDRDEFVTIIGGGWSHRFSQILSASVEAELQMSHLVFLKAERSAMNNWNRIIRLSPAVMISSKYFNMNPQFEVLANYTVYDFEDISPGVQSFSFRQVSYKDSLFIFMGKMFSLHARLSLRYFERGILYWKAFAESPQNSNFEQFTKLLFYYIPTEKVSLGCGVRYYRLSRKNLMKGGGNLFSSDRFQVSFGPEAVLSVSFASGSSISFQGWYEFQRINNEKIKKIPNYSILTSIFL
jgi:hypothetical protein